MGQITIIAWGRTDWADQGRFIGVTDLPLSAAGRAEIETLAESLAAAPPDVIQVGPEEAGRETAAIIASRTGVKAKRTNKELREFNLGIWQGLTEEQVQQRYTGAYEQWRVSPETVCPPEGEPFADAAARLRGAAERVLRRNKDKRVTFVVGPMAAAALRCTLEDRSLRMFWEYHDSRTPQHRLEWPRPAGPESLVAGVIPASALEQKQKDQRLDVKRRVKKHGGGQ